jgi:hypothetical protein
MPGAWWIAVDPLSTGANNTLPHAVAAARAPSAWGLPAPVGINESMPVKILAWLRSAVRVLASSEYLLDV